MKIKLETTKDADGSTWLTDAAKEAVAAALKEVNGNATSFTVCYANQIYELSLQAERYLEKHNVPESDRAGAKLVYRPAGPAANAYKNSAISTVVTLSRTGSGWNFVDVQRSQVYPRQNKRFDITISDRAADNLVRRTLKAFGREPQSDLQVAA